MSTNKKRRSDVQLTKDNYNGDGGGDGGGDTASSSWSAAASSSTTTGRRIVKARRPVAAAAASTGESGSSGGLFSGVNLTASTTSSSAVVGSGAAVPFSFGSAAQPAATAPFSFLGGGGGGAPAATTASLFSTTTTAAAATTVSSKKDVILASHKNLFLMMMDDDEPLNLRKNFMPHIAFSIRKLVAADAADADPLAAVVTNLPKSSATLTAPVAPAVVATTTTASAAASALADQEEGDNWTDLASFDKVAFFRLNEDNEWKKFWKKFCSGTLKLQSLSSKKYRMMLRDDTGVKVWVNMMISQGQKFTYEESKNEKTGQVFGRIVFMGINVDPKDGVQTFLLKAIATTAKAIQEKLQELI